MISAQKIKYKERNEETFMIVLATFYSFSFFPFEISYFKKELLFLLQQEMSIKFIQFSHLVVEK
jgi:hypothetical protein